MAHRSLLTILLLLAAAASATAQSRPARIAHEFCSPYAGDNGYETRCEIHVSDEQGNTVNLIEAAQPSWSPDGKRLLAVRDDVLMFDLASGTAVNLTNRPGWYLSPRWSPDGSRIAFISNRDGGWELYAMNADGSAPTRLAVNLETHGEFAWSPDSAAIAFGATSNGQPDLHVVEVDSLNRRRLTSNAGVNTGTIAGMASPPAWSFDGARIAFDCANDICAVGADGSNLQQLTSDPAGSFGPAFSPVDGRIAFATGQSGALGLVVIDAHGVVTNIAPGVRAKQPAWSAAGDRLLFVHQPERYYACPADGSCVENDTIYVVGSDGSGLSATFGGQNPQWAPAPAGRPFASFTQTCSGSTCQFDGSGSFDGDGAVASYDWTSGDGSAGSTSSVWHTYAAGGTYYVTLTVTDNSGASDIAVAKVFANTSPVASFTVSCSGSTCSFDASASQDPDGTITQYTWMFGDGSSGGGVTATHSFATGSFTATLVVLDNSGAEGTTARTFSVANAAPAAAFTVACTDLTCRFDGSASSDGDGQVSSYRWDFGDGCFAEHNGPAATHTYSTPGTHTATLTVRDNGGATASTSRTVTVASPGMHVGDLDGTSYVAKTTWDATVAIQVHRATHEALPSGAVVSGTWNDGTFGSCTAYDSGQCWIVRGGLAKKVASVTFTIKTITHQTFVYTAAGNHDPEADSNGTVIKIGRQ